MQRTNSNRISLFIEQFIKEEGLAEGLKSVRVYKAWDNAVGPVFAAYTTSKFFNNGTFHCTFTSSMVRNQLFMMKDDIIARMNDELGAGTVTNLVLK